MTRWFAILLLLASPVVAQTRGYQSRACGFDLNFNGVAGEAADCNVCDGSTTDVDGNAVTDDLRYVNCDGGTDSGSCTSGSPCATLQYALDNIGSPGTGQIQAVCIKGTCDSTSARTANIPSGIGGDTGTYTRTASGSEEWDFDYPRYPLIISGWDADNDGEYPPHDTDDTAVFDGNVSSNRDLWLSNTNNQSNIEVAHLTIRDYLLSCNDANTLAPQSNGGPDYLYFHDWYVPNNGQNCGNGRWVDAFGAEGITYHAYENINLENFGGFIFYRGNAAYDNGTQYIRFKNITMTGDGNLDSMTKFWNHWNNIEWLDSSISGEIQRPFIVAQCTQDWVIRNNYISRSAEVGITLQAAEATTCNSPDDRPIDDIIIDRNEIVCDNAGCSGSFNGHIWVGSEDSGGDTNEYVGDITITNNSFYVSSGYSIQRGILIDYPQRGSGTSGVYTIIGNTFYGTYADGALVVSDFAGSGTRVPSQWYIRNNLFSNLSTVDSFSSTPSNFSSSGNLWQTGDSTDEVSGSACGSGPTFVDAANGDLHLDAADPCALDVGSDPGTGVTLCAGCIDFDIDGTARPVNTDWDIGADEYTSGTDVSVSVTGVTVTGVTVD